MNNIEAIVFDLGGVLIDWNPRYLYGKIWPDDEAKLKYFLENICTTAWNGQMDAGKPFAEAVAELQSLHPDEWHEAIGLWHSGWECMLNDEIKATADILRQLHKNNRYRLFALTNWSSETFPTAIERFHFLRDCFQGIVVSGEIKMAKPDRNIFEYTLKKFGLQPSNTLFIDDSLLNVKTAQSLGLHTIHFTSPEQLHRDMAALGIVF